MVLINICNTSVKCKGSAGSHKASNGPYAERLDSKTALCKR